MRAAAKKWGGWGMGCWERTCAVEEACGQGSMVPRTWLVNSFGRNSIVWSASRSERKAEIRVAASLAWIAGL